MRYMVTIGHVEIILDDELDERPTPEHSRDYLRACADTALNTWLALPDVIAAHTEDNA